MRQGNVTDDRSIKARDPPSPIVSRLRIKSPWSGCDQDLNNRSRRTKNGQTLTHVPELSAAMCLWTGQNDRHSNSIEGALEQHRFNPGPNKTEGNLQNHTQWEVWVGGRRRSINASGIEVQVVGNVSISFGWFVQSTRRTNAFFNRFLVTESPNR